MEFVNLLIVGGVSFCSGVLGCIAFSLYLGIKWIDACAWDTQKVEAS